MADLNSEQKKVIKSTILECREILEKDIEQVLINLGIRIDDEWVDINSLPNLNEERKKIRENIEQVIEKLGKGGFEKNKAVREYIKEVAYTYLNRIAALRVLEVRGLIDEILIPRQENGDKSFINSRFYEVAREYCKYNTDEGLSYVINLMFEEIGEEINILFSTEDEYSFISPSSNGLKKIIKLLCTNIDEESWKQDEIIGWIYQYFNDKEKSDVFDRLYNKKQKIKVEDIPAATQLFTPNWIVEWIVDNSLGTLWSEIKEGKRQGKKVEEIKLLDPCCGSGHFLVKAYDIFYQMYLEEGKYSVEEIPFKILENNIHGIDIDLRAIQLTGLILFIKTKSYLKKCDLKINTRGKLILNLVCADAILLNGNRLEELRQNYGKNPVILKMLDVIYEEFEDVILKGSLIQPEKRLFPLFEETQHKAKEELNRKSKKIKGKQIKGQLTLENNELFNKLEINSFSKVDQDLMNTLIMIYNEAVRSKDINRQLFANEAVKSVKLVEIFMKEFDVVVTNPPYMGKRNMNDKLKEYVKEYYSGFDDDLYAVFISRCKEFLSQDGYLGMITQQSFMFIKSYEKLRDWMLNQCTLSKFYHLGTRAFSDISGEKVNTVMFIVQNSIPLENSISEFVNLTNYYSSQEKEEVVKSKDFGSNKYLISQNEFKIISGYPFNYWIHKTVRDLFLQNTKIENIANIVLGMKTSNNAKYVRYLWELPEKTIKGEWKPYEKEATGNNYYGLTRNVVKWDEESINHYKNYYSAQLPNKKYWFKRGISFGLVSGNNFSAKYLPEGYMTDMASNLIVLEDDNEESVFYLLALLNSKFYNYLLNALNPSINYQVNDVKRLPYLLLEDDEKDKIINNSKQIYSLKKNLFAYNEFDNNFKGPILIHENAKGLLEIYEERKKEHSRINKKIYNYYSEIDNIIYTNFKINEEVVQIIENEIYDIKIVKINSIKQEVENLISYIVGVIFGKWKRINDKELDAVIPFGSSIYYEDDIIERFYKVLDEIYGENNADNYIMDMEEILETDLESYLKNKFFKEHFKSYEKRPIYWHICSPKKTFNCFVYYHKLDEDTLYKVKGIYLAKMIERYEEDLKYYNDQLVKAKVDKDKGKEKDLKNKCTELEEKLEDLNILDKNIEGILPYKPDLDQGVLYNIIPLESILAARVSTDKERQKYYEEVKKK